VRVVSGDRCWGPRRGALRPLDADVTVLLAGCEGGCGVGLGSRIGFALLVGCLALGVWLSSAVVARAASWAEHVVPAPLVSGQGQLSSVSCGGANACVAVGGAESPALGGVTLAERWNGSQWSIQATPASVGIPSEDLVGSSLTGVACVSRRECFAVGSSHWREGDVGGSSALIERWDRRTWSIVQRQSERVDDAFNGVSCVSARACVVVGSLTNNNMPSAVPLSVPLVERWNGKRWIFGRAPAPHSSVVAQFAGVSCSSSSSCIAVGSFSTGRGCTSGSGSCVPHVLVERLDGRRWAIQQLGKRLDAAGASLGRVSCAGQMTCIAVGQLHGRPLAARWDGQAWSQLRLPVLSGGVRPLLANVSCASAMACTTDGSVETGTGCVHGPGRCTRLPLVESWDGRRWSIQRIPQPVGATGGTLSGVWCRAQHACVVVGSSGLGVMTLAERGRGRRWTIQPSPEPFYPGPGELKAVSCTSAIACTAVGGVGAGGFAARWGGSLWTNQMTPAVGSLNAVSCTSATACLAVGGGFGSVSAVAVSWTGSGWSSLPTPTISAAFYVELNGVSCAAATACLAVGASAINAADVSPLAEAWNGSSWTIMPTPRPAGVTYATLAAVSCASTTACIAVGSFSRCGGCGGANSALVERWDGTSWTIQSTPGPPFSTLTGASCTSATACVAVGSSSPTVAGADTALVERWDGNSWTSQNTPSPPGSTLTSVSCTSATACEAVGSSGLTTLAEGWDGSNWTIQSTPNTTGDTLSGVSCTSATACQAVGTGPVASAVPLADSFS
jgi:hypothetical protein